MKKSLNCEKCGIYCHNDQWENITISGEYKCLCLNCRKQIKNGNKITIFIRFSGKNEDLKELIERKLDGLEITGIEIN